jgi:hypothetical protein
VTGFNAHCLEKNDYIIDGNREEKTRKSWQWEEYSELFSTCWISNGIIYLSRGTSEEVGNRRLSSRKCQH